MIKNEIHTRVTPETMEQIRQFTKAQNLPTISHAVRWLIDIAFKAVNDELQSHQKNDDIVQLIEQECQVFFARCRDEYDPEDSQLYWFWFDSELEGSWKFDPDSPNNWCPIKRFNSREDAIRDYLQSKCEQHVETNTVPQKMTLHYVNALETTDATIDW